jgi:hypothetical protein
MSNSASALCGVSGCVGGGGEVGLTRQFRSVWSLGMEQLLLELEVKEYQNLGVA